MNLEQPSNIAIAAYPPTLAPNQRILVRMLRTPCKPGLSARDQQHIGGADLLMTSYSTIDRYIHRDMARVLNRSRFDPARDDAVTGNRWPHGYAYEYNYLWDPERPKGKSLCEIGRKQFRRISDDNSAAAAAAYTDQAIDQAWRAIQEQTA